MSMADVDTQIAPLWFVDGDIVLKARWPDYGEIRCYKLHREILSLHSPVLLKHIDDVLETEEKDFMDDTPSVLVPESAPVLEWLLQALYHPSSLLRWKYKSTSFKDVLPLYKLALKYEVNYVTDVLSAQLEQDWPKTLWEWDAFECDDALYFRGIMGFYLDCMYPEPVAAIGFARVANIPSILPAAFYQLSRISTGSDYDKNLDAGRRWKSGLRSARWSDLTKEDHLCLAAGKEQLSHTFMIIQDALTEQIPAQETKCREAWKLMPALKSNDILSDLLEICKPDRLPGAFMCEGCRRRVNEKAKEERLALWEMLPKLFRVPTHGSLNLAFASMALSASA